MRIRNRWTRILRPETTKATEFALELLIANFLKYGFVRGLPSQIPLEIQSAIRNPQSEIAVA